MSIPFSWTRTLNAPGQRAQLDVGPWDDQLYAVAERRDRRSRHIAHRSQKSLLDLTRLAHNLPKDADGGFKLAEVLSVARAWNRAGACTELIQSRGAFTAAVGSGKQEAAPAQGDAAHCRRIWCFPPLSGVGRCDDIHDIFTWIALHFLPFVQF